MRFTLPIPTVPLLLTLISVASAQTCDSGTACGYAAQLCCTGDEICMTNENNQALCSVLDINSVNSTLTLVVSTDLIAMTPTVAVSTDSATVTTTSMSTQITGVTPSPSVSGTGGGEVSATALGSSTRIVSLFSSAAQSADASAESSGVELTASTTSAEPTASTDVDASDAPASTTTGLGGRVERSWYGVVGVGVVVATVWMV